jgi:hypothetical protein
MQGTPAIRGWDNVLRDSQFGCTGGSQPADGGASRSHRTGRKEKPRQGNSEKSKRAKFDHNHFRLCEGKAIKGLQGENRAELLGI